MASILFYFLLRPSLIASETITLHPPCDACRPPVLLRPSPVAPVCFWLVVECHGVVLHPFKAAAFFFLLYLSINPTLGSGRQHSPTRSALVASPLQSPPQHRR